MTGNIVERAQEGDTTAYDTLLAHLEPSLRAFFVQRIGPRFTVDDLVQNTLLRVHRGLCSLRNPNSIDSFARKAALFELHDMYRGRYSPKERVFDPQVPPDVSEKDNSETGSKIDAERVLSVISPRAQRILRLREYGYRYREIATLLNTTESAIKMQVMRAFQKMRRTFTSQQNS